MGKERLFEENIGKPLNEAYFSMQANEKFRIIRPNQMITYNYELYRLNVYVNKNNIITKIDWG